MAFSEKKGITVASGFKLQAEAPLDARTTVATTKDRDELVTINAAYAGLQVYVEADKKLYYYTGTDGGWVAIQSGAGYSHPTGDGNEHLPTVGTDNDGKILVANKSTAGLAEWKSKSDLGLDDASLLFTKGTIPVARLPKGALERLHVVADDTARFKLTKEEVQNGDTVKVREQYDSDGKTIKEPAKMYYVVDDTKLSTKDGYEVYMAGEAASVAWTNVTDRPSRMPNPTKLIINGTSYDGATEKSVDITPTGIGAAAASHKHTKSEITDMPTTMVNPNGLVVKLNGGKEEGKTMFTYTGATEKSVDITPTGIGAAAADHTHLYAGAKKAGGAAVSAEHLENNTTITLSGGATGTVTTNFADSPDISVTVDGTKHSHGNDTITDIDASKIKSGVIDIDRLPQGALERCIVVNNDAARFALTAAKVQVGDTVKVREQYDSDGKTIKEPAKMYFVVDDKKLSTEDGYEVYTAGSATKVPWSGVTGKPSTFPPATHTHNYAGSASAGGAATSANKVNSKLTISCNEIITAVFNGSEDKFVNITPAGIGAATATHGHKYAGSETDGGPANSAKVAIIAETVKVPAGTILMSISDSTDFGTMFGGTWTCIGTLEALVGTNSLTLYVYQKNAE